MLPSSLPILLLIPAVLTLPAADFEPSLPGKHVKRTVPPEIEAEFQTVLKGVNDIVTVMGLPETTNGETMNGEVYYNLLDYCLDLTVHLGVHITRERRLDECCKHIGLSARHCKIWAPRGYLAGLAPNSGVQPLSEPPDDYEAHEMEMENQQENLLPSVQVPQAVQDAAAPVAGVLGTGLLVGSQLFQGGRQSQEIGN